MYTDALLAVDHLMKLAVSGTNWKRPIYAAFSEVDLYKTDCRKRWANNVRLGSKWAFATGVQEKWDQVVRLLVWFQANSFLPSNWDAPRFLCLCVVDAISICREGYEGGSCGMWRSTKRSSCWASQLTLTPCPVEHKYLSVVSWDRKGTRMPSPQNTDWRITLLPLYHGFILPS